MSNNTKEHIYAICLWLIIWWMAARQEFMLFVFTAPLGIGFSLGVLLERMKK